MPRENPRPGFFELGLAFRFLLFQEFRQLFGRTQQANPLFVVKRYRKTAEAVDADAAFLTDAEIERAAAFLAGLLLQRGELCFQFFVAWFGHRQSSLGRRLPTIIRKKRLCMARLALFSEDLDKVAVIVGPRSQGAQRRESAGRLRK